MKAEKARYLKDIKKYCLLNWSIEQKNSLEKEAVQSKNLNEYEA